MNDDFRHTQRSDLEKRLSDLLKSGVTSDEPSLSNLDSSTIDFETGIASGSVGDSESQPQRLAYTQARRSYLQLLHSSVSTAKLTSEKCRL